MPQYPEPTSLVLVAFMPKPHDMDIARLLGWYRIPLRSAPKVVDVDYLAFYQPGAFGKEHRWKIETFAEVRGHELVSRAELFKEETTHPRANEEYFKIQIGPLQNLPRPILAEKWRRITFLYTTGELLANAEILQDLVVRADARQVLWRSLRERALEGREYKARDLPEDAFDIPPEFLAMLMGGLLKEEENKD